MCNYLTQNGRVCSKSPLDNRCSKHPLSKFAEPLTFESVEAAENEMLRLIKAPVANMITCLCGKSMRRWNFAHHCKGPKHLTWMSTMPESKKLLNGWRTANSNELPEYHPFHTNNRSRLDKQEIDDFFGIVIE